MLKKILLLIMIGLFANPVLLCSSGNLLAPPGYVSVDFFSRWEMLPGVSIPETMAGICSVPGKGPVLGEFDTTYITDPYRILGVPEDAELVIIQLTSIGICRSDEINLESDVFPKRKRMSEYPLGHEGGGRIVGFSRNVDPEYIKEHLGEYVAIESHPPILSHWNIPWYDPSIFHDKFSIIGYDPLQGDPVPGTWAEYIVLPIHNAIPVSEKLRKAVNDNICLLEPNGNAVHLVLTLVDWLKEKGIEPKDATVTIIGLGQQGMKMMYLAKHLDMNVIGVDNSKKAVESCISFGMGDKNTILWTENGNMDARIQLLFDGQADAIIDASGYPGVFEEYMPYIKDDGLFMLFGLDDLEQKVPKTGIELGQFVTEQYRRTVTVGEQKITFKGICGRSKKSWDFELKLLEEDDTFIRLINADIQEIGTLFDLATLLYPYNNDKRNVLFDSMKTKKLVMRGLRDSGRDKGKTTDLVFQASQNEGTPLERFLIPDKNAVAALKKSK